MIPKVIQTMERQAKAAEAVPLLTPPGPEHRHTPRPWGVEFRMWQRYLDETVKVLETLDRECRNRIDDGEVLLAKNRR